MTGKLCGSKALAVSFCLFFFFLSLFSNCSWQKLQKMLPYFLGDGRGRLNGKNLSDIDNPGKLMAIYCMI